MRNDSNKTEQFIGLLNQIAHKCAQESRARKRILDRRKQDITLW
jgi:hypothetical protein